jgi:hypothetical protein
MEKYYRTRPGAEPAVSAGLLGLPRMDAGNTAPGLTQRQPVLSEFDRFCLQRVTRHNEEGWASELRHYLKELPADVSKDTDIIKWWQVWLRSFAIVYCIESSYF